MPKCVYCGSEGKLTREHVVPSFLYEFVDVETLGGINAWNESTKSRVGGEHKVKDVCSTCNNQSLSALDAYGRTFQENNGLLKPLYLGEIRLAYRYDLLLRWLMKMQFNGARASGITQHPAAQYKNYMLCGWEPPLPTAVFLLGELLKPHRVIRPDSPYIATINSEGLSNPFLVRITKAVLSEKVANRLKIESVGFGGLFFHVAYIGSDLKRSQAVKLKSRVARDNSWATVIEPGCSSIRLHASQRDFVDMKRGQLLREQSLNENGIAPFDEP